MRKDFEINKENTTHNFICTDCGNIYLVANHLLVKKDEYERLKRLEENVNQVIDLFKLIVRNKDNLQFETPSSPIEILNESIKLLESLSK
jgi:hypothetical protein